VDGRGAKVAFLSNCHFQPICVWYVCVRESARERESIYLYIYCGVCMCVCVHCVCV
jgi:hypothetical protein